jgi:hypothetical protein
MFHHKEMMFLSPVRCGNYADLIVTLYTCIDILHCTP